LNRICSTAADIDVDGSGEGGVIGIDDEFHADLSRALHKAIPHPPDQFTQGEPFHAATGAAAFEARVGEHVFHEMAQAVGLGAERGKIMLLFLRIAHHAFREHFGIHLEGGEGSAELVRDRRHERPASLAQRHGAIKEKSHRHGRHRDASPGHHQRHRQGRTRVAQLGGPRTGRQPNWQRRQHARARIILVAPQRIEAGAGEKVLNAAQQPRTNARPIQPASLDIFPAPGRDAAREHERIPEPDRLHAAFGHLVAHERNAEVVVPRRGAFVGL
jgi:hypothetical protein